MSNKNKNLRSKASVIGVDPASGAKGSVIYCPLSHPEKLQPTQNSKCSPPFYRLDGREMTEYIQKIKEENVLVAWDAPLTGTGENHDQSQTTRAIERLLSREIKESGVNTRGYAMLSHWVVSRRVLGLPRVGPYDLSLNRLPLKLITFEEEGLAAGAHVVEVHPTVAMYCWLTEDFQPYKGSKLNAESKRRAIQANQKALAKKPALAALNPDKAMQNDDELDAYLAYALGHLWLQGNHKVFFLGNAEQGGILLPNSKYTETLRAKLQVNT